MLTQPLQREFRRQGNAILIHLSVDELPADMPLPVGAEMKKMGEEDSVVFKPYWKIVLEVERTVEHVNGWFTAPMLMEDLETWYRKEMTRRGFVEEAADEYHNESSVALSFVNPKHGTKISLSLLSTSAMRKKPQTSLKLSRRIEHGLDELGIMPDEIDERSLAA